MNGTWLQRCSNDKYRGGLESRYEERRIESRIQSRPKFKFSLDAVRDIFA